MKYLSIREWIVVCVVLASSCTDKRYMEPVKVNPPETKYQDNGKAGLASGETAQGVSLERTVDTTLSQDDWPSAEGNVVSIHYRDHNLTEVKIDFYGETGKAASELTAIRGKIVRGISRKIYYRANVDDNVANMKSDTCAYSFEISQSHKLICTGVISSPANVKIECESCIQEAPVILKLVHDVETLIAKCAR